MEEELVKVVVPEEVNGAVKVKSWFVVSKERKLGGNRRGSEG